MIPLAGWGPSHMLFFCKLQKMKPHTFSPTCELQALGVGYFFTLLPTLQSSLGDIDRCSSCQRKWIAHPLSLQDSLRGSSVKIGTIQKILAWPRIKDDTHKSKGVIIFSFYSFPLRTQCVGAKNKLPFRRQHSSSLACSRPTPHRACSRKL